MFFIDDSSNWNFAHRDATETRLLTNLLEELSHIRSFNPISEAESNWASNPSGRPIAIVFFEQV